MSPWKSVSVGAIGRFIWPERQIVFVLAEGGDEMLRKVFKNFSGARNNDI